MNKTNKHTDTLRFIELYRNQEILWNTNLSSYRRNDLKMKAYESISADMRMTVEDVKKKIKSLRTAYSAEKSKVEKSQNESDSAYIPTVFWYNEMAFLDAFLMRRPPADNSQDISNNRAIEMFEEVECNDYFSSEPPVKRPKKEKLINNTIIEECNEFTAFATSISYQLEKFPEKDAYMLMAEIQNLITQRKLKILRRTYSNDCT